MSDLDGLLSGVLAAVSAGDAAALAQLSAPDVELGRLLKHVARTGARILPTSSPQVSGDRAAVPMLWEIGDTSRDPGWLLFARSEAWKFVGHTDDDAVARLFPALPEPRVPSWGELPDDPEAREFAERIVASIGASDGAPAGSDPDAWTAATAPAEDPSLTPGVGEVRALAAAGRAAVQVGFYADDPEWPEESRWVVLERRDGGLHLHSVHHMPGLRTLLDGLEPVAHDG